MRSVSASFRGTLMLNCFYQLPRAGSQLPSASIRAVISNSVHQSFLFQGSDGLGWPHKGSKMAQFGSKTMASRWSRCLGTPHECPETGPRSLYTGRSHNCWGADNDRPQALSIMPSYQQAAHMFCVSIIFGAPESSKNSSGAAAGPPPKRDLEQQTD